MKQIAIIITVSLLITFSGCSERSRNNYDFDVVSSNVTVWEDSTGEFFIILSLEVSNLSNAPLHFLESDFDIVDELGNLIDTMRLVNAYPPIVNSDAIAVYYGVQISDRISDASISLEAIPHIEAEKSRERGVSIGVIDTGRRMGEYTIGIVENFCFRTTYNDVNVAIVSRGSNNEVVSIKTAAIDSISPREQVEFRAEYILVQRDIGQENAPRREFFVYVTP